MTDSIWFNFAVALGLGLLIGLERERSKGEGPTAGRRHPNLRIFQPGWSPRCPTSAPWCFSRPSRRHGDAGRDVLFVQATTTIRSDHGSRPDDCPLLGGLAMSDPELAAGLGVAVAALFAAKARVHDFVKSTLDGRRIE